MSLVLGTVTVETRAVLATLFQHCQIYSDLKIVEDELVMYRSSGVRFRRDVQCLATAPQMFLFGSVYILEIFTDVRT